MKTNKIVSIAMLSLAFFSSCKKEDTQSPANPVTINADGSLNVDDADGRLYTVQSRTYDTYNGSGYETSQYAMGLFGKLPLFADAGIVKVNNIEMDNLSNYYLAAGDALFTGANASASFSVAGNPAEGIAAFTYTDNAPLPTAPEFTLPASININNNLTINHTPTSGNVGVLYNIIGDKDNISKVVSNSSSSVTFTSAEIKAAATSESQIMVSVMGVSYTKATFSGKNYYFVKQHQCTRQTDTQ